ncbi:MAG: DUF1015 domain-containing protein [Desulfobacterales bacterium]
MAAISPFRGIFYNPTKIHHLADVVTPPYDVISESQRLMYQDRHPQNIIRLILNNGRTDTHPEAWARQAADHFQTWRSERALIRDTSPAVYFTALDFPFGSGIATRYGLIARVGLEPFEKGIILPHEQTFSQIKSERLALMKACHANFSPVFSLYSDPDSHIIGALKTAVGKNQPDIDFSDEIDQRHRLWRISDEDVHGFISEQMETKRIFIADGHHRYETALDYRQSLSRDHPGLPVEHPSNSIMMSLCNMEDPGLVILPAHRIVNSLKEAQVSTVVEKSSQYFDVATIPFPEPSRKEAVVEVVSRLQSGASANTIGVYRKDDPNIYILTLKPGTMDLKFGKTLAAPLLDLDVIVLTHLLLMDILGFDKNRLDNDKLIHYSSREELAIEAVSSGRSDIAFILNPTKIDQVQRIAVEGLVMPRKATYFYPKVVTGLVINDLVD